MATTTTPTAGPVGAPPTSAVRKPSGPRRPGLGRPGARRTTAWAYRAGSVAVGVVILAVWEWLSRSGTVSPVILPPASDVAVATSELVRTGLFWRHLQVTMTEIAVGFALGTTVGFTGGVALALWPPLHRLLYPYVAAFQAVPKIVLAPLFIAWFGFDQTSKVAMAVALSFFPVLINTLVGLRSVPDDAQRLMRSLRSSSWTTFRKVSLPYALPMISAGVKTALGLAIVGAIVGEFVGAKEGLGYLLHSYNFQLRIDRVFAIIVVLAALGGLMYALVEWIDRRLVTWTTSEARRP